MSNSKRSRRHGTTEQEVALLGPGGPGVPAGTDDGVGSCAGGLTQIQSDVQAFARFATLLAPQPPDAGATAAIVAQGFAAFTRAGCHGCHVSTAFVTPPSPANGVPGGFAFRPYSDFLVHNMGTLGDMIGNDGDSLDQTRRMRTAPLWGLRFRSRLLHDGRAADVPAAIRAHAGQGASAASAFAALTAADQAALVTALRSI